jgi:hypothetical protein
MRPDKPVKKFALGLRVSSKLNRSFNWVEFANSQTFDTKEEAEKFVRDNVEWNRHRNPNNPSVKNKNVGIFQLTDEEIQQLNK